LCGEEFDAFDKDERSVFRDGKIDHQGPAYYRANLHSQAGQTIRRLADLERIKFQAAADLTKSPCNGFTSVLAPSLTMNAADGVGYGA
jgi:hypothetical protein